MGSWSVGSHKSFVVISLQSFPLAPTNLLRPNSSALSQAAKKLVTKSRPRSRAFYATAINESSRPHRPPHLSTQSPLHHDWWTWPKLERNNFSQLRPRELRLSLTDEHLSHVLQPLKGPI